VRVAGATQRFIEQQEAEAKKLKHELATLRANIITRIYEQSEPYEEPLYNSAGKHVANVRLNT
jgi:hypothetical protein